MQIRLFLQGEGKLQIKGVKFKSGNIEIKLKYQV
jgi:hypothetical protein